MNKYLLFLALIPFGVTAEMLWKPDAISYEFVQAPEARGTGLVLQLNQSLESGEYGWSKSKIDVPEHWQNAKIEMRDGTIFITTEQSVYYLNSTNIGSLKYEILSGNIKTDKQLVSIWGKHAKSI